MTEKERNYQTFYLQAKALFEDENNVLANMGNLCSLLHYGFQFWWTGFYLVEETELVLASFQGPVACTRIGFNKGVCGAAWKEQKAFVVPNVHEFKGHIACSSESNSEVVVPIWHKEKIIGVLDVDSKAYNTFDEIDVQYLTKMVKLIWQ